MSQGVKNSAKTCLHGRIGNKQPVTTLRRAEYEPRVGDALGEGRSTLIADDIDVGINRAARHVTRKIGKQVDFLGRPQIDVPADSKRGDGFEVRAIKIPQGVRAIENPSSHHSIVAGRVDESGSSIAGRYSGKVSEIWCRCQDGGYNRFLSRCGFKK